MQPPPVYMTSPFILSFPTKPLMPAVAACARSTYSSSKSEK
jgi:hypothetical protein